MNLDRRLPTFALCAFALACSATARPQAGPAKPVTDDPKAASLIRDAARPVQERNWDAARKKLDEAKAINPQQADLWSIYGFIALMTDKPNEAAEDFQRELARHPDEDNVSMLLVQAQAYRQQSRGRDCASPSAVSSRSTDHANRGADGGKVVAFP